MNHPLLPRSPSASLVCCALLLAAACATPPPPCPSPRTARGEPTSQPAGDAVVSRADPRFLEQYAATFRFRLGQPKSFALPPDGSQVLFLRSAPRDFSHDLFALDTRTGKTRLLLSAARLLGGEREQLSPAEKARRERMRVLSRGIVAFRLSRDGERVLVPLSGRLFVTPLDGGEVTELGGRGGGRAGTDRPTGHPLDPRLSPDGETVACVRDGDLYLYDVRSGRARRLTRRPGPAVENGLAEFVAQEEMGRHRGYWWSPDSRQLVYQQTDTSGVETLRILDPTRPETRPHRTAYPRAGKPNARVRLGVIAARGGRTRWLAWDRERYPYLVNVHWSRGAPLTVVVQNRAQTEVAVLAADPRTGKTRALHVERDPAWVNIDQQMPRWLPDGSGFLWTSDRAGMTRLELRDSGGKLVRPLTPEGLNHRKLVDLAPAADELFVEANTGGAGATEVHLYRLSLSAGAAPVRVSRERGHHEAVFAREHSHYVHSLQTLSGVRRHRVLTRDGKQVATIASRSERPPFLPNMALVQVGQRELNALVLRPRGFDAGRRYPVVVYVYGGPNHQAVTARPFRYLLHQWVADHGFVVVVIDGRGTPGRGRAWERAIKGNFIAVPLQDQVAGLRALGARFPELDLGRVGIYGWSFGGYVAAMAVMLEPDVYHAAAAVAPVTDWFDYDTHYTERYLGFPADNPDGYRASSAVAHASRLTRPLLLIHGTADDNVYFSHSLELSDALFRAGRPHRFLPLTNFTHLVPDPLVTRRLYSRIVGFLRRSLAAR